jgi:hypothetical protein
MHINHLVIVSGPFCSGKSTLLKNLRENKIPLISDKLGMDIPSTWKYVELVAPTHIEYELNLQKISKSPIDRLIVGYDFLHTMLMKRIPSYEEDERLDVLYNSDEITFVTLWAKREILTERNKLREKRYFFKNFNLQGVIKFSKSKFKSHILFNRSRRVKKITDLYNSSFLYNSYDKWFDFINAFNGSTNWIGDNSMNNIKNLKLLPQSKWQDIIEHDN